MFNQFSCSPVIVNNYDTLDAITQNIEQAPHFQKNTKTQIKTKRKEIKIKRTSLIEIFQIFRNLLTFKNVN